eukprot:TRINITY_DN20361_c0_g1_i1.p1 TRINITY_DN20361_c0_g1~~TRINITY_DN20361_c0_g1_i1.p1  ORF type:complete len:588 (+),score=69.69 TRINITY_DN20361_c0_g1_i1:60-1766(+)
MLASTAMVVPARAMSRWPALPLWWHCHCSSHAAAITAAAAAVAAAFAAWMQERSRRRRLELETKEMRDTCQNLSDVSRRAVQLRDEERRGRIRAEQRLRALSSASAVHAADGSDDVDAKVLAVVDDQGGKDCDVPVIPNDGKVARVLPGIDAGYVFRPIGFFKSCYRSRCGTPRQGGIVPESLAVLRCVRDLNPASALDGFTAFSHCWVLYVFHENTNLPVEGRTVAKRTGQRRGRVPLWQGICMKVAPPRCTDKDFKVGVLACRTPHRPNPIGLSLARVVHVDAKAGEVTLAGLDVVDGTPCLDLKPYLPSFESVPAATVPSWVQSSFEEPLMKVEWSPAADAAFTSLVRPGSDEEQDDEQVDEPGSTGKASHVSVKPFSSRMSLRRAVEGTLALDIRSPLQRERHPNPLLVCNARRRAAAEEAGLEHSPAGVASHKERHTNSGNSVIARRRGVSGDAAAKEPFFVGDLWFHDLHITYTLLAAVISEDDGAPASVRIEWVEPRDTAQATSKSKPKVAVLEAQKQIGAKEMLGVDCGDENACPSRGTFLHGESMPEGDHVEGSIQNRA